MLFVACCLFVLLVLSSDAFSPFPLIDRQQRYRTQIQLGDVETKLSPIILENVKDWIKNQDLNSFIPKDDINLIISDVKTHDNVWENFEKQYIQLWTDVDQKLRNEVRPLKEILGKETTTEILAAVEKTNIYDPETVRTFLRTPAFEAMMGGILYEGIFEFIRRVDIIGNIVNSLPVIGPIRQTIVKEFKKSLDATLGSQVKIFLASFNRIAVQRMAEFILSPENSKSFLKANRNLVESILSRPINSFLPDKKASELYRDDIWKSFKQLPIEEARNAVEIVYDLFEGKRTSDFIDIDKSLNALPSAKRASEQLIERFLVSEWGIRALNAAKEM
eukprot:gene3473-6914_t